MSNNTVNEHALIISRELNIMRKHVSATIRLLDDGASVPFIARYRKEKTGSLDEGAIRSIQLRHDALTDIYKRRDAIIKELKRQDDLTPELKARLLETIDPQVIDDIYLPYRPRRATRAQAARERGLEPLARLLMDQSVESPRAAAAPYVNPKAEVLDEDAALAGACDIVAEWVSEAEKARALVRSRFVRSAVITSRVVAGMEDTDEARPYRDYFSHSEPLRMCSTQRYLAMRRGESLGVLKVSIGIDDTEMTGRLQRMFVRSGTPRECADLLRAAVADGYRRLMRPSIENEVAADHKEKCDTATISAIQDTLRALLMAPPLKGKRVMGIEPGYRTGCKIAIIDEQGTLLAHETMFPNPPANDVYGAGDLVCGMADHFRIDVIALGSGAAACEADRSAASAARETERFLRDVRFPRQVAIHTFTDGCAAAYAASEAARQEFPDLDPATISAVSTARRLLDPMAELVKADLKALDLDPWQRDISQPRLREAIDYTIASCVNSVGANLNTASEELLRHVSGIGPGLARNIVTHRSEHGPFTSRAQLLDVSRMGEKAYLLSAPFLRIPAAPNRLDNTAVHPEQYPLLEQIAADMGLQLRDLVTDRGKLHSIDLEAYATKETGLPTLTDIITELEKPDHDPRQRPQHTPADTYTDAKSYDNLHIGQELTGKVTNITDFGVFVDIGLKNNGLIHVSQLSDDYVESPFEVAQIGKFIKVKVIDIDAQRGRVALTLRGLSK